MLFKKIVSVVIASAMAASICCISVSASGFTSDNRQEGTVTEVKGTKNDGTWERTHTGAGGTTRTSVTMKAKTAVSGAIGIVNVYDVSNSGYSCKFAHSAFRFNCTAGFQIRIRNGGSGNIQWMNFSSGGYIGANSNGTNKGVEWTPGEDHRIDIIADNEHGVGYLYLDKKLASYSTNLPKDGKWYGYLIYTAGSWEEGDQFVWKYGHTNQNYQYVKYNDTDDYTVSIEDVLLDSGVIEAPEGDSSLFLENTSARDYMRGANGADITYADSDSTVIKGEYYNESAGYANAFMYMLNGFYEEGKIKVGGNLVYITYTQQVNNASRVEMRIRTSGGDNNNNNRFTCVPEDGKIRVSSFSKETRTLDKEWNQTINVGILVDQGEKKAYIFIDGEKLGDAFDYEGDFRDLRMYLNGTEEDNVASVTLMNWTLRLYDSTKDSDGIIAELSGLPIYFSSADNALEIDGDAIGMAVTARGTYGVEPVENAKLYAGIYAGEGQLIDLYVWDYVDGYTKDDIEFEYTGNEKTVKVFCFSPQLDVLAVPNIFVIPSAAEVE